MIDDREHERIERQSSELLPPLSGLLELIQLLECRAFESLILEELGIARSTSIGFDQWI